MRCVLGHGPGPAKSTRERVKNRAPITSVEDAAWTSGNPIPSHLRHAPAARTDPMQRPADLPGATCHLEQHAGVPPRSSVRSMIWLRGGDYHSAPSLPFQLHQRQSQKPTPHRRGGCRILHLCTTMRTIRIPADASMQLPCLLALCPRLEPALPLREAVVCRSESETPGNNTAAYEVDRLRKVAISTRHASNTVLRPAFTIVRNQSHWTSWCREATQKTPQGPFFPRAQLNAESDC